MLQRRQLCSRRRRRREDADENAVTYDQVTDGLNTRLSVAAAAMSTSDSFAVDWGPPKFDDSLAIHCGLFRLNYAHQNNKTGGKLS